jgi:putative hydrolase of the HAD superfamily
MMTDPAATRAAFHSVEAWIFDLDNTLYPAHLSLWEQIDGRIKGYVAKLLNISTDEAFKLQKDYYKRYGTSLRGLMIEHGLKPDDFLSYVHDIDHSPLQADPELGAAIAALPGRKFVFTSGTRSHVAAVTRRLGIENHFDGIFDIVDAGLLPKPHRPTYEKFLADHGVTAGRAAMFEDLARNLDVPHQLGMKTVLVVPEKTREVFREAWEFEGREDDHVDFITDDLTAFLITLRL